MKSAFENLNVYQAFLLGSILTLFITYLIVIIKINAHIENERTQNNMYRQKIMDQFNEH